MSLTRPEFQFEVREERILKVTVDANPGHVEQFGKALVDAGQDGFTIKSIQIHEIGQRDPVTTGLSIRLGKVGS